MRCIITAGPSIEQLDEVRRLTNFSTGRLGVELANSLQSSGHEVTLLLSEQATWPGQRCVAREERFSSGADLRERLENLARGNVGAVFHAAAVADFAFGRIWLQRGDGRLEEVHAGKLPTREGVLLAELVPTPKIIAGLRALFPRSVLVGWKYEVEGGQAAVIEAAVQQIAACATDACVANGPAYGAGFGLVRRTGTSTHLEERFALFNALKQLLDG